MSAQRMLAEVNAQEAQRRAEAARHHIAVRNAARENSPHRRGILRAIYLRMMGLRFRLRRVDSPPRSLQSVGLRLTSHRSSCAAVDALSPIDTSHPSDCTPQ
jgi:hypothetical protein